MISRMKSVFNRATDLFGVRNGLDSEQQTGESSPKPTYGRLNSPLNYHRPLFLNLSKEKKEEVLDHRTRPVIVPSDSSLLPFFSGYCEVVNAGKSALNEDCAVALTIVLESLSTTNSKCFLHSVKKLSVNECGEYGDSYMVPISANDIVAHSSAQETEQNSSNADDIKSSNGNKPLDCNDNTHEAAEDDSVKRKPSSCQNGDATSSVEVQKQSTDNKTNSSGGDENDVAFNENPAETKSAGAQQPKTAMDDTARCQDTCKCTCEKHLRLDYFAIFDGHAGEGAALYASRVLHEILVERIREIQHLLVKSYWSTKPIPNSLSETHPSEMPTNLYSDSLITGLLQDVMCLTDKHLEVDQQKYNISGGCTALVVLFILGKMFVAGAGDCRAVLSRTVHDITTTHLDNTSPNRDTKIRALPMSQDFTPSTERRRLQFLAYVKPSLLGTHFSRIEFIRKVTSSDLGKKVLHRDYHMTGWSYKEVTSEDLRHPLIYGSGKGRRLLATIGVTRGLGDHKLIALNQFHDVPVKPFMSSVPEVRVYDLASRVHGDDDVLIMGSDGLWDAISNEMAAKLVTSVLQKLDKDDPNRYCAAAKELALKVRGEFIEGSWKMANDKSSSFDDITVFVIPLRPASTVHA